MHEMCPPNCPLWPLETNSKIGIFAALPENKLNSETEKRSRETIGEKWNCRNRIVAAIFQKLYFRSGNVKRKLQSWNSKSETETTNAKVKVESNVKEEQWEKVSLQLHEGGRPGRLAFESGINYQSFHCNDAICSTLPQNCITICISVIVNPSMKSISSKSKELKYPKAQFCLKLWITSYLYVAFFTK